ncbi:hypothetical protein [Bacillus sp. Marseille-Q3570]|uniref:hypothetical protein n=1 Tax=Bacillus sp. Marseille-Q3570 TaxID=2963522 RepID=UPI0021B767E0|nr:hypothetical protein [Bacillus sp. Marseille-Q3570]
MKIQLGILGPEDSIERIKQFAEQMNDFDIAYFPYTHASESEELIKGNEKQIDHWFLSGPALYRYLIRNRLLEEENTSYPDLYGSSLMGSIVEALTTMEDRIQRVSLDTIRDPELESVKNDFNLSNIEFFLYQGEEFLPATEVIEYHESLYKKGKTDAVLTCIKTVYLSMKEKGIPCFRVIPSRLGIELELRFIKEHAQANWYRKSSLGIVGVEAGLPKEQQDNQSYSYKMKQQILDLKRLMLDYSEKVQGSFVEVGDALYFIYTTRGELELKAREINPSQVVNDFEKQTGLALNLGVGYGMTAWEAEQNVRHALQLSREEGKQTVVVVNEEKEVTLHQHSEKLTYQQRFSGENWERKLKDAKISPAMISKIASYYRYYEKDFVTAKEIAQWLKSTDRNARRILTELERLDLATIKGEEQGGRGRPRKVYKLEI